MPMTDYFRNTVLQAFLNGVPAFWAGQHQIALLVQELEASDGSAVLSTKTPQSADYSNLSFTAGPAGLSVPGTSSGQYGNGVTVNVVPLSFKPPLKGNSWGYVTHTAIIAAPPVTPLIPQPSANALGYLSVAFGTPTGAPAQPCIWSRILSPPGWVDWQNPIPPILPSRYRIWISPRGCGDPCRNAILFGFGLGIATIPNTYYLALLTNLPASDGTGFNECTNPGSNGYSRTAIPRDGTQFTAAVDGICYGSQTIQYFPTGSGSTSPIVAWALVDSQSSAVGPGAGNGQIWWYGKFRPKKKAWSTNANIVIEPGDMSIGFDIGAGG